MADGAHRSPGFRSDRRGLWQALVEADATRRAAIAESDGVEPVDAAQAADEVIDLASYAEAHLGYLERVGAMDHGALVDDEGSAVVFDLAEHRSRRALIA